MTLEVDRGVRSGEEEKKKKRKKKKEEKQQLYELLAENQAEWTVRQI